MYELLGALGVGHNSQRHGMYLRVPIRQMRRLISHKEITVRTDEDINEFVCGNLVNSQFSSLGDSRGWSGRLHESLHHSYVTYLRTSVKAVNCNER